MSQTFQDRRDAGRRLAESLSSYADQPDAVVLALPRGGVPVAYEVAEALGLPLDMFVVRKLGVPGHEELAIGAIASGGTSYVDHGAAARLGIGAEVIDEIARREEIELLRRERRYRIGGAPIPVRDRVVILVDDGLATGATMRAAVGAVRERDAARIVVAVPVAAPEVRELFSEIADEIVCVTIPEAMTAIGMSYEDFTQTTDEEVRRLLMVAQQRPGGTLRYG